MPTFHKINVHAAMSPRDIQTVFNPAFEQARALQEIYQRKAQKEKEAAECRIALLETRMKESKERQRRSFWNFRFGSHCDDDEFSSDVSSTITIPSKTPCVTVSSVNAFHYALHLRHTVFFRTLRHAWLQYIYVYILFVIQ